MDIGWGDAQPTVVFSFSPVNEMEFAMSRTKSILQAIIEAQEAGLLPDPSPKSPEVHILICNGDPIAAYVDAQTADYEMRLCIQGDEAELGMVNSYEIKTLGLTTHRL
jgi:hypothetical protein